MEKKESTPSYAAYKNWFKRRTAATCAQHLLPYLREDCRIIDVGCGVGSITLDLARQTPGGYVLGVDKDASSIEVAEEEARLRGIDNVEFAVGDATDLAHLETNSFDLAHCHQVLLHLVDPVKALKEIHRIIRPLGVVASRDNFLLQVHPPYPAIERNWDIYREFSRERGSNPDGGLHSPLWMHQAGFPWESIQSGIVALEHSGEEGRRNWAEAQRPGMSVIYHQPADFRFLEKLGGELDNFAENPAAAVVVIDRWVIGRK